MVDIVSGLIGISGALIGVSANELLRRFNRIETFSTKVFEKRLEAYEGLMSRLQSGYGVATEIMQADDLPADERHAAISTIIQDIAAFTDQHVLYLDYELAGHCVATFMGAEDVCDLCEIERAPARQAVLDMYVEAKRMIREDSGVERIHRVFRRAAKPRFKGAFIRRLRELQRDNDRATQKTKLPAA